MSRLYIKNNRGRQPTQPTPRLLKTKDISDDTYQEPISRRHLGPRGSKISKYGTTVQQTKRRRMSTSTSSGLNSSEEDFDADDASDEQSDDEEADEADEPATLAPSQHGLLVGPGLKRNANYYGFDRATSVESMFGLPTIDLDGEEFPTAEAALAYERKVLADSDDEIYEGVNDVSDSDDENCEQYDEDQLIADGISEDELEELDLLNHIDGMSAYGFGDESEDGTVAYPPSSYDSDSADAGHQRHVRFDVHTDVLLNPRLSESPTFSRSLLPSAMPAMKGILADPEKDENHQSEDEDYDSDVTDECLPPEAQMSQQQADPTTKPKSPAINPIDTPFTGPKWGHFIDDGEKPSGILDPTGKIVLITHPHLLGDEFVRRYNDSAASSPGNAFEEILDGSDIASIADFGEIAPLGSVDVMLGNLNASRDVNGVITGPQETFIPAGFNLDDFGTDLDSEYQSEGEDVIKIDDVIKFDDDSDDSDATTAASPIFVAPRTPASARQHRHLSSLNSHTVTAFRRSADPNFASFRTTPSFSRLAELSSPLATSGSRKRKMTNESPYASSHYAGVTPVQRMSAHEHAQTTPSTPDTIRPKRQRLMTA